MTTHTVGFAVGSDGKREMFIDTNDLQALSDADWFREYLALRNPARSAQTTQQTQQDISAIISQLQQENMQLRQIVQQQQQQRAQAQQAPTSPDGLGARQPQRPQQQQQQQRRLPTSFLELTPDKMTPDIWASLVSEQQDQWMKHYNLG